jgi:CHAT domain-containing protein/Tfp pilus assembly protein PilF
MHITVRAALIGILLIAADAVGAQTPPPARAQALLASTKSGQEASVGCGTFDEPLGRALIALGTQVRGESLERATVAFRLAERAGRCLESDALTGAALNELGNVLNLRGENDGALAAARESQQIHTRLKDDAALAQAVNIVGNVHWGRGEMREALEEYRRALDAWMAAGDRPSQARALNNIGNVHRSLGEFEIALGYQTRAQRAFEELGDRYRAAVVSDNIGITHFSRGDYSIAVEYSRHGLELARSAQNKQAEAKCLDSLGNEYRALGAYQLALQSFEEALKLRTAVDDKPGVMETSHNIGLVHFSQGDYGLAIAAYKHALRLNRELHGREFDTEALLNIGAAAWHLGERDRAAADFRESLAIARREGFRTHEGELLQDMGDMALAEGRRTEAAGLFARALDLRRDIGDQAGITESLTSVASTRLAARQFEAAGELARQAIGNATAHDQPELLWRAQTVAGLAYRGLRRQDEARKLLTESIATIEQLSGQMAGSENLRQRFFEDKLSPYHELIALDIEQHAFGDALELAERSKARVLAQLLRGSRVDQSAILTPAERQELARRRDALLGVDRQIAAEQGKPTADGTRVQALQAERRDSREALAAFESALASRHPELAAARGVVKPLTMSGVARLLTDPSLVGVEYVVGDRQLFSFVMTSDGAHVAIDARAIDITSAELARRADRFRQLISSRDLGATEDSRALYTLLLGAFQSRLAGKTRLVVVPDAALWNVPFQALAGPNGYVIESAAVSYAPSLTVVDEILKLPRSTAPPTLLAMGKATFDPRLSGEPLEALPEAENQVREIRKLYGADRSVAFVGEQATEGKFKAAAPRYSVLHLATHGILDEASPLYSHLVLSIDPNSPDDDGRLEAWELMRLKLAADVVVLAACETARGRVAPGEGVVGTMWALLAAGARSMVVSQYRVESRSATALLVGFHRRLASGHGGAAGDLRAAALDLLHSPAYAHPYYWAGFVLVGAWD